MSNVTIKSRGLIITLIGLFGFLLLFNGVMSKVQENPNFSSENKNRVVLVELFTSEG
ncbi:MAG: hypothetical protein ABEJ65_08075 [bacterium]